MSMRNKLQRTLVSSFVAAATSAGGMTVVLADETQPEEVAPYQLKIIKRGESQPLGDNNTAAGQQENRRVDVHLLRKPEPKPSTESSAIVAGGGGV